MKRKFLKMDNCIFRDNMSDFTSLCRARSSRRVSLFAGGPALCGFCILCMRVWNKQTNTKRGLRNTWGRPVSCVSLTCDSFPFSHPSSFCWAGGFWPPRTFALLNQRPERESWGRRRFKLREVLIYTSNQQRILLRILKSATFEVTKNK